MIGIGGTDCIDGGATRARVAAAIAISVIAGEIEHERKDVAAMLFRQLMDARSRCRMAQLLGGQTFVPLGSARKILTWRPSGKGHA